MSCGVHQRVQRTQKFHPFSGIPANTGNQPKLFVLILRLQISFFLKIILFIYFWLCWVFIAARAFLQLQHTSFSLQQLLLLQNTGCKTCGLQCLQHLGSVVAAPGLSSTSLLSSRSTQALLLLSMWDLPRLRTEPMSPALAGGFFTTELPGKAQISESH